MDKNIIVLQVGDQRFTTRRDTLTGESDFFSSLLSGRWNNHPEEEALFIDADPELFKHILQYLRRRMPPLFYTTANGHDHAMYRALLHEAEYFGIGALQEWLQDRKYLQAVEVKYWVEDGLVDDLGFPWTLSSDTMVEVHPIAGVKKVYVCPRGIWKHRGHPEYCGRKCENAQGDAPPKYDEESVCNVVKKQIHFCNV